MRRTRVDALLLATALVAVLTLLAACGGDDDASDVEPVTFDIKTGADFFEPNGFTVAPRQEITFNITNESDQPHNMRIAGADNEYMTDDDVFSGPMLAGDAETITWIAPREPGDYNFRCDFHPRRVVGVITVEPADP